MGCEIEGASFMIGYDSYDGVVEPTEPVDCDSHMFFLHFHLPDHQDPRWFLWFDTCHFGGSYKFGKCPDVQSAELKGW